MLGKCIGENEQDKLERNSIRDRLAVTDAQIAQLDHQIDRLEMALGPILLPEQLKNEGCLTTPELPRCEIAQAAHEQGARVYRAHCRISEILSRVSV